MSMSIGLNVGFGGFPPSGKGKGRVGSVQITGLTGGRAIPGQHDAIGAAMSDGSTIVTFAWGAVPDGTEFGIGPVPADFSSGAGGLLYLMVTTEDGTARAQAAIAEAAPVVTAALPAVSWTVGRTITPIDLGDVVSGDNLIFGGAAYPGTSLNTVTGEITGAPMLEGAVSRVFTASNGSGIVEIPLTGSVVPAAPVVVAPVPDQSLVVSEPMTALNLNDYVTGAALAFSLASGALPAGLGITGGLIAGVPELPQIPEDVVFTASNGGGSVVVTVRFAVVAAGVAPRLAQRMTIDDATNTWGVVSDQTGGALHWSRLDREDPTPSANGTGGWTGAVLESGTLPYTGGPLEIDDGGTTGTVYKLAVYHRNNGRDSNVLGTVYTADNTAPTLALATPTVGDAMVGVAVSTDEGDGVLYWLVTPAADAVPDAAAVRAGNSRAVTASGAQALITLNGLTNDTQYRVSFLHRDAHRNDSAVVSQTFIPTTGASNIVTPIVDGFTIEAMASVPAVTPTAIADGFLIEDA